jgi:DedD protein
MVLDTEPQPVTGQVDIKIPSTDSGAFTSRVVPVPPPGESKAKAAAKPPARPVPDPKPAAQAAAPVDKPAGAPAPGAGDRKPVPEKAAPPADAATVKTSAARKADKQPAGPPFVVQVIALADAGKAKQLQMQIAGAGIKSYTEVVKTAKGEVTRVRAGPFGTRAQAEKARDQLKAIGLSGNVVPK